jgi:hypothetical protein
MIAATEVVPAPGVGHVLRRAARDFYEESWRLVALNTALSAYVLAVLAIASFAPLALVLVVGAGPIAAALFRVSVVVVESGSLTFVETAEAFRRCWRRGLVLAGLVGLWVIATVIAVRFYGDSGTLAWPLAVLVLYLGAIVVLYQLVLWPLAVQDCARPLRDVAVDAAAVLVRRPGATVALGVALLVVNALGVLAAVLPFLTMTFAYSALAAARFVIAPRPLEEV